MAKLNLSSVAEVQLVCILQELLANVRKHAHTRKVDVSMSRIKENGKDWISLQVIDDGIGLSGQRSKHSFGLNTMQERANSVGGALELQSPPGKGTVVACRLPCLETERLKESQIISTQKEKSFMPELGPSNECSRMGFTGLYHFDPDGAWHAAGIMEPAPLWK